MRLAIALVVASAPLHAAPIPKEKPAAKVPNHFPCELYTKWEYECGKNTSVVEVTKVRHEKDCRIVTFTHTRPSDGTMGIQLCRVTKDGVWGLGSGKNADKESLMLRFPLKPGDTWTEEVRGLGKITSIVREPTTVEVPAGKFAVLGTSWTVQGVPAEVFNITEFYADGVGRVMTPPGRAGQAPILLKKFIPPPK